MAMSMIDFTTYPQLREGMGIFESFEHKHEMKKMKMATDEESKTPTNKVICPKNV